MGKQQFFNSRSAKLAEPGTVLLVEEAAGLRLCVTSSTRSWIYRYKNEDGKIKQLKLGEWPAMPLEKAMAGWRATGDQRASGVDPVRQKKAQAAQKSTEVFQTNADLLNDFMDSYLDVERKAPNSARARLERFLAEEPAFARCHPRDVTRSMAFKILSDRRKFPTATKQLRSLIGQAVDRALDAGRADEKTLNWWRLIMHGQLRSQGKIVNGKHVGRSKRVLSETDLSLFLPWIESGMRELQRDITLMYLFTGMRGVEIVGLRSEYVTEEHDGWWATIPIHVLKMERDMDIVDHRVPLVGRALEIVTRRLERAHDGWLFWTDRGKVLRPYSQKVFSTFCYDIQPNHSTVKAKRPKNEICPVTGWTPHDLRRTARTLLGSIDCPQEIGESIIGHKPKEMVATYNLHTYDRQKRKWLPILAAKLEQLYHAGLPSRP